MEDLLIKVLTDKFGYPVILQGSLSPDEPYPNHFFTFWNTDSENSAYYDNSSNTYIYTYNLNFYSIDAEAVYTVLREAIEELKKYGFIISGDGHSVATDDLTHDGRGTNVYYRKNQEVKTYGIF